MATFYIGFMLILWNIWDKSFNQNCFEMIALKNKCKPRFLVSRGSLFACCVVLPLDETIQISGVFMLTLQFKNPTLHFRLCFLPQRERSPPKQSASLISTSSSGPALPASEGGGGKVVKCQRSEVDVSRLMVGEEA